MRNERRALAYPQRNGKSNARVRALRDMFVSAVLKEIQGTFLAGDKNRRLPGNANIGFSGCRGEQIMIKLDMRGICVSTGSACSSGASKPSPVLLSMGLSEEEAASCVRFTFGRENTEEEVKSAVKILAEVVGEIRSMR